MAVCSKCNGDISGKTVTFGDNPYHPECFVCKQCGEQLSGKMILQHEGENYDEACYASSFAKKCGQCGELCMNPDVEYIVYNDETFHPDCFACGECKKAIAGKNFAIKEDKRVCEDCF